MNVNRKKAFVHYLAMWGCICTGIVYAGIGIIAILSFLRIKDGGADESSMLVYLHEFLVGRIFVWVILSGMIAFIIWRIYETIYDPYGYGNKASGIFRRALILLSSLADAMISYSAIQAMFEITLSKATGEADAEQEFAGTLLRNDRGAIFLVLIGSVLLIVALSQLYYVISNAYKERLDIHMLKAWKQKAIHVLAWAGHFSRGVILGIIGFFFVKAGITEKERYVVNTDKAFDFLGDHVGHFSFLLVAAGTICYGLYMFFLGKFYDSDKH